MTKEDKKIDKFREDWQEARDYWVKKHPILDFAYLQYRSILTFNSLWGKNYLDAFGLSVYVPLTYQTIESISSATNSRKIDIIVEALGLTGEKREKFFQKLDNAEWSRSKSDDVRAEANKNALIFGNGYYLNIFKDDTREYHFPVTKKETESAPQDPEDGIEQESDQNLPADKNKIKWEKKKITKYKGMKPQSLDPYSVFTDPSATCDDDREYVYTYTVTTVPKLRQFVVDNGWMTEAEAKIKIKEGYNVEHFDKVRQTTDELFSYASTAWGRKDGAGYSPITQNNGTPTQKRKDEIALIERWEDDHYEARIDGLLDETIYEDYSIYPHKSIPIVTVWDNKVPGEFMGMGEAEIMRWQQVEANRVHNSVLTAMLMSTSQRYAIRADLLEDETDIAFWNPNKPIRLKNLPGLVNVNNAIMPMTQPDVKQTPFQLMELIKDTVQQTTGASDFVVAGSDAQTDTATESNNLVAATSNRMKEKTRQMDEVSIPRVVEQWHSCYAVFYTEDMDLRLTGEKGFMRYIPLDREEANENEELIKEAKEKMKAEGATLEEVYMNKGYKFVIFLSDTVGGFSVKIELTDLDMNADKELRQYLTAIDLFNRLNQAAQAQGETKRFDVFKLGEKALKVLPMVEEAEDYIKDMMAGQMPGAMQGMPGQQGQPQPGAPQPGQPQPGAQPEIPPQQTTELSPPPQEQPMMV